MATQPDFWGDIEFESIVTPAKILREQASLLGKKTQNMVEANVRTQTFRGLFYHSFNLVVPTLDNYTYELFKISHAADLYPVMIVSEANEKLDTEDQFKECVHQILSSEKTKRVVANLLAQVNR